MFTGIVQAVGKILQTYQNEKGGWILLSLPSQMKLQKGESLAVNGVCLTICEIKKNQVMCDCMPETFRVTNLGELKKNQEVNLETPLKLNTPLGGHLVQGHVDGIGKILSIKQEGNSKVIKIQASKPLCVYFIKKGSVAVDGVSLTIVKRFSNGFLVSLIPMTWQKTILGRKKKGASVNIEVDIIAKYIENFCKPCGKPREKSSIKLRRQNVSI